MITTVLFDMDGTLLPMDTEAFEKLYFKTLTAKVAPLGYKPNELLQAVWAGTRAMILNDGSRLNSAVFWEVFCGIYGNKALEHIKYFDNYYQTDFALAKQACGFNPKAAKLTQALKDKGIRLVLATNPLFPSVAQTSRLGWAGVDVANFDLVTHYDNSHFCKPNLSYYEEILSTFNLDASECLMVGNDVDEDMIASKLGMKVFLVTDCLINKSNKDVAAYPHGSFDDLERYLGELTVL